LGGKKKKGYKQARRNKVSKGGGLYAGTDMTGIVLGITSYLRRGHDKRKENTI